MSSLYPRSAAELAFAPVLIAIERNLQWLRNCDDLDLALALDLNDDEIWYHSASERADRVRRSAVRFVDLHGLEVTPTGDGHGLKVSHGAYSVSVMLGIRLATYVEYGHTPSRASGAVA